jgi:hypothetical protein
LYNNSTDWGLFQENVRNNLRFNISLKLEQEIEDSTNDFIITTQRGAWSASPITRKNIRKEVNIPNEIPQLEQNDEQEQNGTDHITQWTKTSTID